MSEWEWAIALLVMGLGALLQGCVGFGGNQVAAPIILLLNEDLVPGSLLVCAFSLTLLLSIRNRSGLDVGTAGNAMLGRVPGSVMGALCVAALSRRGLSLVFGVGILTAVLLSAFGVRVRQTRRSTAAAGFASGFGATALAVGGPPMALLMADDSGNRLRGTLSGFFFVGTIISMGVLAVVGEFDGTDLTNGLILLPGTVTGFLLSKPLAPLVDRGFIRPLVLVVAGGGALAVLLRALL